MTGRSDDGSYHGAMLVVVIACSVSVRIRGTYPPRIIQTDISASPRI